MIELELTYLAKYLPEDLQKCNSKQIVDLYVENGTDHADLRIRKNGDKYEFTRKTPVDDGDTSKQNEATIDLNEVEFDSFKNTQARKVAKTRYYYSHDGKTAEFDVFEDTLLGLVVIDFEFENESEKDSFLMPEFCLADITQEKFIAGGMLAGKSYDDIANELEQFNYEKLTF